MFKYFPHTPEDLAAMLEKVGAKSIDDLFVDIPKSIRWKKDYKVPESMSEMEIRQHMQDLADANQRLCVFRGAGAYDHETPSIIKPLISRQEFLTSYTPYQPEIAQGTLQYIFEYQSMICELTGMDVSNASMYDGATATAEALFMAQAASKSPRMLVSDLVNPEIVSVVETYAHFRGLHIEKVRSTNGTLDRAHLKDLLEDGTASLLVQYPNFFGVVEDFSDVAQLVHDHQGLFIMNANPSLLSVLKTPREQGADIAVGDGQSLGIPLSFGGPYFGYLTTTTPLVRKMPGRIVGMTKDVDGKRAFVLTLQAREQHIRREKANSNICSNQSLMALFATIYVAALGKQGMIDVNTRCIQATHELYDRLIKTGAFHPAFDAPFAHEAVLTSELDFIKLNDRLLKKGILGGFPVKLPDSKKTGWLFAVTERRTPAQIDALVQEVEMMAHEVL